MRHGTWPLTVTLTARRDPEAWELADALAAPIDACPCPCQQGCTCPPGVCACEGGCVR